MLAYCFDGRQEGFHYGLFGYLGLGDWRCFEVVLGMLCLLLGFEYMVVVGLMLLVEEDPRERLA